MTVTGPLTIELHRALQAQGIDLRVLLDGRDVTEGCVYADEANGHVALMAQWAIAHHVRGRAYMLNGRLAVVDAFGTVKYRRARKPRRAPRQQRPRPVALVAGRRAIALED